jgi:hypothetical protein
VATVTAVIGRVYDGAAEARAEVDYDDASNPDNWDLIAVRCVNNLSRDAILRIRRGNGSSWFTVVIPADQTRSMNAGGPVRRMNDIPTWELSV